MLVIIMTIYYLAVISIILVLLKKPAKKIVATVSKAVDEACQHLGGVVSGILAYIIIEQILSEGEEDDV